MNIGVVGGSGFIGRHIVDQLIARGHDVTVFDIMLPARKDIRHIYIDITDAAKATVALAGAYDVIYMLAAMADVNDVYHNPVEAGVVNIIGVANVLEACRRHGIPRVILASSIWVYDAAEAEEVDEETPIVPAQVNHVYTASKLAAEMYCHAYHALYGLHYTILRYGIPYGPGARDTTVLATFVRHALQGEPLTIHGDGFQYRSFIYVEDLAAGNVAALHAAAVDKTFNLAGARLVSVKEVAETVQRFMQHVEIQYLEARPGDAVGKQVSSRRAQEVLGWTPRMEFEEGVRRYVEWAQAALGAHR